MGIIKAMRASVAGTLEDQWLEFFSCDSLGPGILLRRGRAVKGPSSANHGNPENITPGSTFAVADGQAAIIVDGGKVTDVCMEPGEHTYVDDDRAGIFGGGGIGGIAKDAWERFGYGGDYAHFQRIYYVNLLEIMGNRFKTMAPIPVRLIDDNLGLDIDYGVECSGRYSYRVTDPACFYKKVTGMVTSSYFAADLEPLLGAEFASALIGALPKVIGERGVRPKDLPLLVPVLSKVLVDEINKNITERLGICVVRVAFESISFTEQDTRDLRRYQFTAMLKDAGTAAAYLVDAYAEASKTAAANPAGAAAGLMGMNMAMGMTQPQTPVNTQGLSQLQRPAEPAKKKPLAGQALYEQVKNGGLSPSVSTYIPSTADSEYVQKMRGENKTPEAEVTPDGVIPLSVVNLEQHDRLIYTEKITTAEERNEDDAHSANPFEGGLNKVKDSMRQYPAIWTCTCGRLNKQKFCPDCGKSRLFRWTCRCGKINESKFCDFCGTNYADIR